MRTNLHQHSTSLNGIKTASGNSIRITDANEGRWSIIEIGIKILEKNQDLTITTKVDYVIDYLTKEIRMEKRATTNTIIHRLTELFANAGAMRYI